MKERIKTLFKSEKLCYLLLFLVSCLLLYSYVFSGDTLISGHDTLFHVSNISVIESTLDFSELKLIPSPILPDIANNLGYGIGLFYPRLPHLVGAYIAHIIINFGGSIILGIKITHLLVVFLSAVFMYKFSKRVFKNPKVAFFAALFYITSSYFISDILFRDAFAESFQFLFLPIIMTGLYELFHGQKKTFYLYFIIGYIGMLNSHLVLSIFLTFAFIIYLLFHLKEIFREQKLGSLIIASIIILILAIPDLIPLLQHKMLASIAVFSNNLISSSGLVSSCAISPFAYLFPFYEGTMIQFFINIVVLLLLITVCKRRKEIFKTKIENKLLISFLVIGLIFFILTTRLTPWKYAPNFLLMIQFPWRLEIIVVFITSFLAGTYFLLPNIKHIKTKEIVITALVLIFGIITTIPQSTRDFVIQDNLENIYISEYGMGWSKEYLPVSTIDKGKSYLYQTNAVKSVNNEKISITNFINKVPNMSFDIEILNKVTIEIPRLHYLGYDIKFTDNKKTITIPYKESNVGMIEVDIPSSGTVTITYPGTKSYQITKVVRTVFLLTLTGYIFITTITKKPKETK